jgi:hypothetical protein
MPRYIGVKVVEAEPMTAPEFNEQVRPMKHYGESQEGYKVVYETGYESWSPKDVFDKAYRRIDGMTFGLAIEAMKKGFKVQRKGWNGKGMFIYYIPVGHYAPCTKVAESIVGPDRKVEYGAYIAMKTAQGNVVPWLASQTDMLSDDWRVVD